MAEGEGARYEPLYLVAVPPRRKGGGDAEPGLSSGSDGPRRPDGRAQIRVGADEQREVGTGRGCVCDQGDRDVDVGLLLFVGRPRRAATTTRLLLGLVPAVNYLRQLPSWACRALRYAC